MWSLSFHVRLLNRPIRLLCSCTSSKGASLTRSVIFLFGVTVFGQSHMPFWHFARLQEEKLDMSKFLVSIEPRTCGPASASCIGGANWWLEALHFLRVWRQEKGSSGLYVLGVEARCTEWSYLYPMSFFFTFGQKLWRGRAKIQDHETPWKYWRSGFVPKGVLRKSTGLWLSFRIFSSSNCHGYLRQIHHFRTHPFGPHFLYLRWRYVETTAAPVSCTAFVDDRELEKLRRWDVGCWMLTTDTWWLTPLSGLEPQWI